MPVPASFSDISETAASNSPQGSETVGTIMNQYIQQSYAFIKMLYDGQGLPTASVDNNNQKLINVANGTATNDAVNYGQLQAYLPLSGGTLSGALNGTSATFSGNVTSTSGIVKIGLGSLGAEVDYILQNNNTNGQLFLATNGVTGFYDIGRALVRYNSDNSGNFSAAGNLTAYSDETLKTNWKDLPKNFVYKFAKIKRGNYDRIDVKLKQTGVSAQSLKSVMPRAVVKGKDGKLSVAYGQAALVGSIEVAEYAVSLEERIKILEREIRILKRKVK